MLLPKLVFRRQRSLQTTINLYWQLRTGTTLSYKHSVRSELGDIGGPENSISKGIWAHSVMLLDVDSERTIGLIDQQRWIRNDDDRGKKHERKQRPYEDKESFKWQKIFRKH